MIRLNTETGETGQQKLAQASDDAERFYRELPGPSLIIMEARATVIGRWICWRRSWHQLRVGDAAQIRASYVRQQKTDKRDAAHILKAAGGRTISACLAAVK